MKEVPCFQSLQSRLLFFLSEPVAFRRVYGLESHSRTSGESNHHRQSATRGRRKKKACSRGFGTRLIEVPARLNLKCWQLCCLAGILGRRSRRTQSERIRGKPREAQAQKIEAKQFYKRTWSSKPESRRAKMNFFCMRYATENGERGEKLTPGRPFQAKPVLRKFSGARISPASCFENDCVSWGKRRACRLLLEPWLFAAKRRPISLFHPSVSCCWRACRFRAGGRLPFEQKPNQTSILGSGRNRQLPHEINWTFLSHLLCWVVFNGIANWTLYWSNYQLFWGYRRIDGLACYLEFRRPDGSVGMALVLPALTDCRWWFESLLVHSGVSRATRRKATGADHKKKLACYLEFIFFAAVERV